MDVRIADAGVIVSTGELISGDRGDRKLFRLVCDVARANLDEDALVCIRRAGCEVIGLGAEVNDGVRLEWLEVDRRF